MNALELFETWAPEAAPWSPWAKPVLFVEPSPLSERAKQDWLAARDGPRRWTPATMTQTALVLDLPGPLALALALDCASHGWRPVPLFNSCAGERALVDNEPIRAGLAEGAALLRRVSLPDSAPPAFVLDARRLDGAPAPERFDNRWVVFPQDFPSAARLLASDLRRLILVQDGRREPRPDLAHVLLRWQKAGVEILALDRDGDGSPAPIAVPEPSRFRALGYRALVALGLRKSSAGGFGGLIPSPHVGGGGFA